MKWSQPADARVVEAVVEAFREPSDGLYALILPLSAAQWERSYYWLDASGMALYLLDRLQALNLVETLPPVVRTRLRQNLADNFIRSAAMFRECAELNQAFQAAGIDYCNLKGFTLSPDSCPDPNLRTQLDFDFLVDGAHLDRCRDILARKGYVLCGATATVWEFKTASNELASIANFYKPKKQRCVEIHFSVSLDADAKPSRDARLDRLQQMHRDGLDFPALAPVDQFIGQATHLLAHLCGPCTRLAWALEFNRHVERHFDDQAFWREVCHEGLRDRDIEIAVGVSCVIVQELFGASIPELLEAGPVERLPEAVRLWVEVYGERAVLADFPGTKLHLLLREQLHTNEAPFREVRRTALLPSRRPARIIHVRPDAGLWKRLRGEWYQRRYELFRLRFHVVEGVAYLFESLLWKQTLRRDHQRGEADATQSQAVQPR